jgi:cytochrome c553
MAELISKLPPPTAPQPNDRARMERAQALVHEHRCNFCHTADFTGQENVPRLAGQREDYLVKSLREYKSNVRRGYEPWMSNVLYAINDEEIVDLAYFLAHAR